MSQGRSRTTRPPGSCSLAVFTVKDCVELGATASDDATSKTVSLRANQGYWRHKNFIGRQGSTGAVHCVLFVRTNDAVPLAEFVVIELITIFPFDTSDSKSEAESVQGGAGSIYRKGNRAGGRGAAGITVRDGTETDPFLPGTYCRALERSRGGPAAVRVGRP